MRFLAAWLPRLRHFLLHPAVIGGGLGLVVLVAVFALRVHSIAATMPYPVHIDEPYLTEPAGRVLTDGDWNPHFFMYPSLPIYVTAGAFSAGYLSAASHGEVKSTQEVGRVGYPFYRQDRVVWPAKLLFVLFSVLAMAGAAWVAFRLSGEPALLALVPAVLALSPSHHKFSWSYMNVNVMGDALVWLTLVFLLVKLEHRGFGAKAIFPGLLVGATFATKYNFGSLVVPALLVIAWRGGERRVAKAFTLCGVAAATFLVTVPYSWLDVPAFLNDLGKIMGIYQEGFVNNQAEPGLPHLLLNLRKVIEDLGWPTLPVALVGLWSLLRKAPGHTGLVLSFPFLLLVHMSLQKAHFLRNLLSLFPLYSLLVAAGLVFALRGLQRLMVARAPEHRLAAWAPLALVTVLAVGILPLAQARAEWQVKLDSRRVAVDWMLENLPPKSHLVAAEELSIDLRPLTEAGHTASRLPFRQETPSSLLARLAKPGPNVVVLFPVFGARHWDEAVTAAYQPIAEELNRLRNLLVPLKQFGDGEVSVIFEHVLAGHPQFLVARLELSEAERAGLGNPQKVPLTSFEGTVGEGNRLGPDELALYSSAPARSTPVALTAGRWRLVLLARGTEAKGKPARLRLRLGDRVLGVVSLRPHLREEIFEFDLPADTTAPVELEVTNDRIEKLADGTLADRNAYLRSLHLFSLGAATGGPR